MSRPVVLAGPSPPGLHESIKNSTSQWQDDLAALFKNAKDRFPDVIWELSNDHQLHNGDGEEMFEFNASLDDEERRRTVTLNRAHIEEVWGHKAIVYARAPPSFQSRYFSFRPNASLSESPLPYSSDYHTAEDDEDDDGPHPYRAPSAISLGTTLGLEVPGGSTILISRTPSPTSTMNRKQAQLLRISTTINPALFSNELEYLYTGQGFGEAFEFLFDSSEHQGPVGEEGGHTSIGGGAVSGNLGNGLGLSGNGSFLGSMGGSTEDGIDAESLRIDKLRKDLVFMWRSRLYSDVRIALTGNFGSTNGAHENTTAIFSSHRFMLASRSPYFYSALLGGFSGGPGAKGAVALAKEKEKDGNEPPTLTLPSPPFTPASVHFTLGFIYTGTLIFSHRTYDLSTAFALLRAALYLGLTSLHDEVQARIVYEMLHGLFHAFLPFAEYEKLTQGKWGVGGCRCRQCARRVPRVLEFSLAEDVKNTHLERGSRRALVGLFGEGWCMQEFASLSPKLRDSLLKGLAKRTTPQNVWAMLWAAEHALAKLGPVIEPWGDTVRENVFSARKAVDEVICRESERVFGEEEWCEVMEGEEVRFGDSEKVEWAMAAVLRGVKEAWVAGVYQTLVSSILLRPHPTEENAPLLSATSSIRVQVEQTRLELLKWIGRRWIGIRQEQGFDALEGWALKEISDHIEVPIEDLLTPPNAKALPQRNLSPQNQQNAGGNQKLRNTGSTFLRPMSQHPHTSRIDADSDAASSMRVSFLTRSTHTGRSASTREGGPLTVVGGPASSYTASLSPSNRRRGTRAESLSSSVRSSVRSVSTFESGGSASTVGASARKKTGTGASVVSVSTRHGGDGVRDSGVGGDTTIGAGGGGDDLADSPAKRIAASVRSRMKMDEKRDRERERPDSKLTPSDLSSLRSSEMEFPGVRDPPAKSPSPRHSVTDSAYDEDVRMEDAEERQGEDEVAETRDEGEEDNDDSDRSMDGDSTSTAGASSIHRGRVGSAGDDRKTPTRLQSRKSTLSNASTSTRPVKKMVITRASLASVTSRGTVSSMGRPKSSASSIRSVQTNSGTRKTSGGSVASSVNTRPNSRGSTRTTTTVSTAPSRTASSRSTLSSISTASRSTTGSRPHSRLSTISTSTAGGRPVSSVSTVSSTTDMTFRTASQGGALTTPLTPTARTRKTSAASTVSNASVRTATSVSGPVMPRVRKISTGSVSSVASARSPVSGKREKAPPVPPIDPTKLSPAITRKPAASTVKGKAAAAPSLRSSSSTVSLASAARKGAVPVKKVASSPAPTVKAVVVESKEENADKEMGAAPPEKEEKPAESLPTTPAISVKSLVSVAATSSAASSGSGEHKKSSSSASVSSVATLTTRKRDSVDTITSRHTSKSKEAPVVHSATRATSPPLPALPQQEEDYSDYVPTGATLDIGIPCIISCKRKRFKAYARYIGEVAGELGPWVGVEVPMPSWEGSGYGYSTMNTGPPSNTFSEIDEGQWNDGSWAGIRYFEISNDGWDEDRAARRRRVEAGSVGGAVWGHTSGSSYASTVFKPNLKREGDSLSVSTERMKKMRSVSPTMSESSSMVESRGLFVRPQQVLYVVGAVGADL